MVINMRLSISNIAWDAGADKIVYALMKKYGYSGLEIAPTRIFEKNPYEALEPATKWSSELKSEYGFEIPSMQSIWFGKTEKLFEDKAQMEILSQYTKKAIDFAQAVCCKNLVFGSPKNRALPDNASKELVSSGIKFFKALGEYALTKNTAIGMEANPAIYNTNYINDTKSALQLIKEVESKGFLLNLDIGAMLENKEQIEVLEGNSDYINHVHISEPFLKPIGMTKERQSFHNELSCFLKENNYKGFVSIEMGKAEDIAVIEEILAYVKEIFNDN